MNRRKLMVATGVLAVLGAASAVAAVGERGGRSGHGLWGEGASHRAGHGLRLKRLDADKDGSVSLTEFLKPGEDRFTRLDVNQDGVLDAAEITGPMKARADFRNKRMLKGLDQNKDGKISEDEFQRLPRERFAARDLDDDGKITAADMPPSRRERAEQRQSQAEQQGKAAEGAARRQRGPATLERVLEVSGKRFKALDANGDGFIDAQELEMRHSERLAYATRRAMHGLDKNRDGKVTREEFTDRARGRFAYRDLDDNGKIDADDLPPGLKNRGKR